MAGTTGKPAVPRKRNRKRKRRADVSSSSSSSSSPDSDSDSEPAGVATVRRKVTTTQQEFENGNSDSSTSGPESSEEDSEPEESAQTETIKASQGEPTPPADKPARARSTSPSPPSTAIPSFLAPQHPDEGTETTARREQEMKEKFRKFWMGAVADGFRDDLEEIRKEPNLTTSKLSVLIESLASGADLFSSTDKNGVNEMEMLVG